MTSKVEWLACITCGRSGSSYSRMDNFGTVANSWLCFNFYKSGSTALVLCHIQELR